ncbi:hypothetical protein [Bacillus vallismortis]|uniref:hypothetical protein n=1 Tax=Bacillus vallismortis TaxID=72361 RepID=UPI00227EC5BE|nr:hypothetical protein [Bacillus vallismortis]MCY7918701.1 hypothetical protein [Bacillus vallismortis]MCY8310280.1 hypothetical protein [Bacillus vallismortis]
MIIPIHFFEKQAEDKRLSFGLVNAHDHRWVSPFCHVKTYIKAIRANLIGGQDVAGLPF